MTTNPMNQDGTLFRVFLYGAALFYLIIGAIGVGNGIMPAFALICLGIHLAIPWGRFLETEFSRKWMDGTKTLAAALLGPWLLVKSFESLLERLH